MQVTVPPLKYDHAYSGPVIERILPLAEARQLCASIGIYADGCSAFVTGENGSHACYIILPSDGFDTVAAYRRHETAHRNGWGPTHPPE
jgi:hypothetical protein